MPSLSSPLTCLAIVTAPALCAAGEANLIFWHNQLVSDVVSSIVGGFSKKTGIPVDTSWIGQDNFKAALVGHAAEGDPPDVALVPADYLGLDKELRLSTIPDGMQAKSIVQSALQAGVYEGRTLGAPVNWGNHLLLFYNRDLVKKPARTFAELEQQAPLLKQKGAKPLGMNFGEMYWLAPFIGAFGGWPLDERGNVALDTPATAQALEFYFSLVGKGLTDKDCRTDCSLDRFARGEFAYSIGGDWMFRDLEEKMGAKLGAAVLPAIDKRMLKPMFSAYVLVFPNDALRGPKRERLVKFLRYMQSPDVQRRWAYEVKVLPVNEMVFKDFAARAGSNKKASLEQLKYARAMPNDRGMAFAWEGMAKGFSAMYNGRATGEVAARLMQMQAEKRAKRDGG